MTMEAVEKEIIKVRLIAAKLDCCVRCINYHGFFMPPDCVQDCDNCDAHKAFMKALKEYDISI